MNKDARHAKHVDQVLLGDVVLLVDVALERREDLSTAKQALAGDPLEPEQLAISVTLDVGPRLSVRGRDDKVLELLAENDDALFEQKRVGWRVVPGARLDERVLGGEQAARVRRRAVEVIGRLLPEVEHEAERPGVKLGVAIRQRVVVSCCPSTCEG